MPASEMGESMTRSGPNLSTRPTSTLKGVPASATSSPTNEDARIPLHLLSERFFDGLTEGNLSLLPVGVLL